MQKSIVIVFLFVFTISFSNVNKCIERLKTIKTCDKTMLSSSECPVNEDTAMKICVHLEKIYDETQSK